jgi:hypothetical protein
MKEGSMKKRLILLLLGLLPIGALAQNVAYPASSYRCNPNFIPLYSTDQNGLPVLNCSHLQDNGTQLLYNGNPVGGASGALVGPLEFHIASGSASLNFTSWYSSSYDEYVVEILNLVPATNSVSLNMQVSTNGGSSYDSSTLYSNADWRSILNASASGGNSSSTSLILASPDATISSTAAQGGASETFKLVNPGSTIFYKQVNGSGGYVSTAPSITTHIFSDIYSNTAAVNAFKVFFSSGNIASGTIRIYGVAH